MGQTLGVFSITEGLPGHPAAQHSTCFRNRESPATLHNKKDWSFLQCQKGVKCSEQIPAPFAQHSLAACTRCFSTGGKSHGIDLQKEDSTYQQFLREVWKQLWRLRDTKKHILRSGTQFCAMVFPIVLHSSHL